MIAIFAAVAMTAAPSPAATKPAVAGLYQIQQMEMGGGLELRADGRFRYAFSYGAADEMAEGDWQFDGKTVYLTSNPMPKDSAFKLVRDEPAPACTLMMSVDWGKLSAISSIDVVVSYAGEETPHLVQTDENGDIKTERCDVTSVAPLVPVYGRSTAPIPLKPGTGHRLSLRFVPNDLGRAALKEEPLRLDHGNLIMDRYETEIRFVRAQP